MEVAIGIVILIFLLLVGVPVLFSFAGATMFIVYMSANASTVSLLPTAYGKLVSVIMFSVPMFIMAGGIMAEGKLGDALVDFVEKFVGRIKGCLAYVLIITCAIFGSISGSAVATMSCIGTVMAPRMKASKYPHHITAAIVCCASVLGILIPPSILQIIYAWAAAQSVLACFLAIVTPGITLMFLLCVCSYIMLRKCPDIISRPPQTPKVWVKDLGAKTTYALPALIMPIIILGGIYSGIMTPTEAAAVSVFYAIPVCIHVYKGIRYRDLKRIFVSTAVDTGVVMVMIGFVMIFSRLIVQDNLPQEIAAWMTAVSDNKIIILLMVNLFMILVGMLMDDTSGTLLCTPMLLPIIVAVGMSPVQFAAVLGVNIGLGCITPPSAPLLYLASRICKVNVTDMLKPVGFMMLFAFVPVLLLTTYWPQFSLWLPQLLLGYTY